ncbi:MAG: tRNA (adenosine(37)-N6)-dimethylallyltransferase MiaA [Desulfobulbaceae bacterium]|nr:tRNA (adenosine(37)-N6)-dimethylallyltransferase MiaA [Desulfobulbaceae bacterium]
MTKSRKKSKQRIVAIVGPTAVGKTKLVLELANHLDGEIVNVDSMQIYRFMDIGTAKPSREEQRTVRHHLLDIVNPDEEYNVSCFVNDAERVCSDIISRGKRPILTGGTGLYLKGFQEGVFDIAGDEAALQLRAKLENELLGKGRAHLFGRLQKCDSVSAARIHPNDTYRLLRTLQVFEQTGIPWSVHLARQQQAVIDSSHRSILKIGLTCDREQLYERINKRTRKMFEIGLLDEVRSLLDMGYGPDLKAMQSIGYRHAVKFLAGEWDKDEALRIMARDTRRYAKRQFTWFKKDQQISWFNPKQVTEISSTINTYLDESL